MPSPPAVVSRPRAVRSPRAVALAIGLLATTGATAPLAAQATFEGRITLRMQGPRGGTDIEYLAKDGKVRANLSGGMPGYMLVEPARQQLLIVMPAQRMYMLQDLAREMNAAEPPKITRTGKKETIAGRECEQWQVTSANGTTTICMAKGLGTFALGRGPMGRGLPQWSKELARDGAFPLRVSDAGGATILEVTKIEPTPLDAALFEVPPGFQAVPAGMMGPGMGGMGGPGARPPRP